MCEAVGTNHPADFSELKFGCSLGLSQPLSCWQFSKIIIVITRIIRGADAYLGSPESVLTWKVFKPEAVELVL